MSGLRYFADQMHELIAIEARLKQINANAHAYAEACRAERAASLPRTDRVSPSFHKANEGLCAVNIILGGNSR